MGPPRGSCCALQNHGEFKCALRSMWKVQTLKRVGKPLLRSLCSKSLRVSYVADHSLWDLSSDPHFLSSGRGRPKEPEDSFCHWKQIAIFCYGTKTVGGC